MPARRGRSALLLDYLEAGLSLHRDCADWVGCWVETVTGIDPAAAFRGLHDDDASATALIAEHGGYLALMSATMAAFGYLPTNTPLDGDIGAVEAAMWIDGRAKIGLAPAIRGFGLWHAKAGFGIRAEDWPAKAAWAIV